MRHLYLGAATALMLGLAGCGGIYGEHSDESYRSNAGFTRENPAPVGPPVPGPAAAAMSARIPATARRGAFDPA